MAERPRHLDRRDTDSARSSLYQQRFLTFQSGPLEHVDPHREEGLGKSRSLDERIAARDRQALRRGRGDILGVAAAGHQRADPIAGFPFIHACAGGDDGAGHLEPWYVGCAGRWRVAALALQDVGSVDAGRGDLDQNLI